MAFSFEKFKLREVGKWYVNNGAVIPAIQRELLWTPKQVALLWDSIFKGIPIGTFMLQKSDNALLDGQQRLNAIATGYDLTISHNTVIWLDYQGNEEISDSDIMVTTASHPWGYRKDENRSILSASERRDAYEAFKILISEDKSFYNLPNGLNLYHTWPTKHTGILIPLSCLLQEAKDEDSYVENATSYYSKLFPKVYNHFSEVFDDFKEKLNLALIQLFSKFQALEDYEIGTTIADLEEVSDVEMLFSRLNTGGTQISGDDLAYAVIKTYFPFVKQYDEKAREYNVEPSKLARFVLRIAATSIDKSDFAGNLTPKQIRQKANEQSFKDAVKEYYDNLEETLCKVKEIFDINNTPTILRVGLAAQSPESYLLLLYICQQCHELSDELKGLLCGIVFYMKWFCRDSAKAANIIYHNIKTGITIDKLKSGVLETLSHTSRGLTIGMPLITPNNLSNLISIQAKDSWQPSFGIWGELWNITAYNRDMLLFFQRDYISKNFKNYNPTNYKLWAEHNCPWDYDHIIPQNWFCNYSSTHRLARFCKYWQNTIGNLAAISFEANRSKSDDSDWSYYDDNESLCVDTAKIKTVSRNFNSVVSEAQTFAETCFKRYCTIYKDCYSNLFHNIFNNSHEHHSNIVRLRKEKLEKFAKLTNGDIYFVYPGGSIEYQINGYPETFWEMPWLSCGTIIDETYYVAVTIGFENNVTTYEIGVRKAPKDSSIDATKTLHVNIDNYSTENDGWWFLYREITEEVFNDLNIIDEFQKLCLAVNACIQ